jgi:hypothetical protein
MEQQVLRDTMEQLEQLDLKVIKEMRAIKVLPVFTDPLVLQDQPEQRA